MRHGKQLDKYLFIELHSVYLLGVLSLLLSLLGVLRQKGENPNRILSFFVPGKAYATGALCKIFIPIKE